MDYPQVVFRSLAVIGPSVASCATAHAPQSRLVGRTRVVACGESLEI
jgi:hypothetical protein